MPINPSEVCLNSQAAVNRLTRRYRKRRAAKRFWNQWNENTASGTIGGDLVLGCMIVAPFVVGLFFGGR